MELKEKKAVEFANTLCPGSGPETSKLWSFANVGFMAGWEAAQAELKTGKLAGWEVALTKTKTAGEK